MHKDYIKYQDVKTTFISDNDGDDDCYLRNKTSVPVFYRRIKHWYVFGSV